MLRHAIRLSNIPDNVVWDPAHYFFRRFAQINGGKMDRFIAMALALHPAPPAGLAKADPVRLSFDLSKPSAAVLGYYTRDDLPHYHGLADEYVRFDNFFQAMSDGSTGNALYLAAARSAVWHEAPTQLNLGDLPTLLDLPYDKDGILIGDLPPLNGPMEISMAALLVSPFARRGYVDHKVADITSALAFIAKRFGPQALQQRDATAYPLLDGLDFSQKSRDPAFT